jgi:hypothetical protein
MDSPFNLGIAWLINGYIRYRLTISEHEELGEWVCRSHNNQRIGSTPVIIYFW